ncbi:hypothetical protein GCM10009716_12570 [Streptomyces sodiiphilus]|uniref:Uncharacterized protein n=1 Tax=Streptomyces sodiiphilus TaxID=226217 RepID=A0ABN2NV59_9ACTN
MKTMTTITTMTGKLAGCAVNASCLPGSRLSGTGVSGAAGVRPVSVVIRERIGARPTQAPAVAAAAQADVYAFAANGAGHQLFGQQKTQLHTMWALRGLNPWSDHT